MGIKEHFDNNLFNYFLASIPMTIVFLISAYVIMVFRRDSIRANWDSLKCKPYVIPFVSSFKTFKEGPITGTTNHFFYCVSQILQPFFEIFFAPINAAVKMVQSVILSFAKAVNNIRKQYVSLQALTTVSFANIFDSFEHISTELREQYIKQIEIMRKFTGLNKIIAYMMQTIGYTMFTIFNTVGKIVKAIIIFLIALAFIILLLLCSPCLKVLAKLAHGIGKAWVCFDEDTLITVSDGSQRNIQCIRLGDKIMFGGTVTGLFKFSSKNVPMYTYNNTIVSGCHIVNENGKWIYVKDSTISTKIENYTKKYIYCLSTENNCIYINNTLFSDYLDVSDKEFVSKIKNMQLNKINKTNCTKEMTENFGFVYNTKIKMKDGTFKEIYKIDVGDVTEFGKINGTIKLQREPTTNFYKNKYNDNLIVSETQWIQEDDKWICVNESKDFDKICLDNQYIYQLLTESGFIKLGNYTFADYNDLCHTYPELIDEIDCLILEHRNL